MNWYTLNQANMNDCVRDQTWPLPASSDRRSNSPPPGLMNRRDFPNLKNNHRGTWGKGLGGSSSGVDSWRSGPPNVRGTRDEDAFANGPRRGPGGYDMDPRDYNRWNDYDHGKPPSGKYVPSSLTQQQQSSQQVWAVTHFYLLDLCCKSH